MSRPVPCRKTLTGFVVLLCLVALFPVPGSAQLGTAALPATQTVDPDTVLLDVALATNGDADWEIRYLVRLDDENATDAFASLERDVAANRSAYASGFAARITGTVAAAENATGREMRVRNVTVRTTRQEVTRSYGVLIYAFEWTNFGDTNGTRINAGDAIAGLFLDETTSLTVSWPDGYRVVSTAPDPDEAGDNSVTWRGPADFTTGQPRVVVSGASTPLPTDDQGAGGVPTSLVTGVILVILVGAGLGWWWRRRASGPPTGEPDEAGPPDELLSNEERVLLFVRDHGGRIKQQQVVEELGWTDAKTSQVVSDLRDAGELEGFRLGRENVLRLPDEEEPNGDE